MKKNSNTKLLSYILEKERKEKAAKRKRILLIIGGVLLVASAGFGYFYQEETVAVPAKQVFSFEKMSLQGVARMLQEDPTGIVVRKEGSETLDTLHSIGEYKFLVGIGSRPANTLAMAQPVVNESLELTAEPVSEFDPELDRAKREVQAASQRVNINEPVVSADIMPSYPGGEAALYQFLSKQIRYPRQAVKNKTEGTVYVRFVIQPDGAITDPEVMRGIGYGCDEEALRVISSMPAWNPGEITGQKVPVFSSLAVNFKFL